MIKLEISPGTALCPLPVALVSCYDKNNDRTNVITIAWCGIIASNPAMLSISIRPSRHSYKLIKREREFVVNIPSENILRQIDISGVISGRDKDKVRICNFSTSLPSKINTKLINECPINIECSVVKIIRLGSHDMFISKIVAVHCDKSIINNRGGINFKKVKLFTYLQGEYWNLNKKIGYYGYSKKKKKAL